MREIVLDTETTGLDPGAGHRVVEVGCIELVNMVATGNSLQLYLNPEMPMPTAASIKLMRMPSAGRLNHFSTVRFRTA